ncbi:MAG: C45 family peptidase, partial [Rikenellaceae bacterium]
MKKVLKYTLISLLIILFLPIALSVGLYYSADMGEPTFSIDRTDFVTVDSLRFKSCNGNYLRQNNYGLWELTLKGDPIRRGAVNGSLVKDLLYFQETVFINQINEIIPSDGYLKFLRFMTVIFNRNLGQYIPAEYREEIWGIAQFCTDQYNAIGTPYERQLNFHAAHDIGHTMQEYMLVGCSSFGVWNSMSADSSLLIGRNFDFYVGDDFAKNKVISIVSPKKGYRFVSVGWAGMIGVLSGMNEEGLTVTINAAKGSIPTSAAMPISILAREILQYASTIDEAYGIAKKHHTFVSESLLIGSAKDGRAAIIEKTPTQIDLFESPTDKIICTNHYQSEELKNDPANLENIARSDSYYRYCK